MKYYTKEWNELMIKLGTAELFEPVIDKEYSDEEIEALYEEFREKYIQEAHDSYDEPPYFVLEGDEEPDPEDFDPEDYLIGDIDEEGEEINLRNPASLEELREYQRREHERELFEYENRPPFDEEVAGEEFDEEYQDNLSEPDEDVPQWIRDSVDPRLIAMWALPEGVYRQYMEEERRNQERFDELDDAAADAAEETYENIPEDYYTLIEDLDEITGDYISAIERGDGELAIVLMGCNEDGEDVQRTIVLEDAEILEDEGTDIEAGPDEDGDFISNCSLDCYEVYFEEDKIELHLLIDNEEHGLKYLTARCGDLIITQEKL